MFENGQSLLRPPNEHIDQKTFMDIKETTDCEELRRTPGEMLLVIKLSHIINLWIQGYKRA